MLDLIGESLGLGPDTERIEAARSVNVLMRYLRAQGKHAATRKTLEGLLDRLERLDPSPGASRVRRLPDSLPNPADKAQVLQFLILPVAGLPDTSEVAAARKQLLGFLKDEASDERLLERLRVRARKSGVQIGFIVAGIADYVDSNVGWYADHQLEAIQSGMARANFTFDRFYLADWPRGGQGTAANAHRETPGAVVFRGTNPNGGKLLQVVLLVPETPTAGLHRDALGNALALARDWDSSPLRILGPMFSGSVDSLYRALREDDRIWQRRLVSIVSGSATAASNRQVLEKDSELHCSTVDHEKWVKFSSTAHSFPEWLRSLKRYLSTIDPCPPDKPDEPCWARGDSMAVLQESNTPFGMQAGRESSANTKVENETLVDVFPRARRIAFPLHISRLREAASDAAAGAPRSSLLSRVLIPLVARDNPAATDQLPLLTPDLTGASVQATMASMFDSLRRERYRVVMIVATDERDALHLAREVRRTAPDTQLVFFGAQMLLLHPDYASYTRGALVVSSYPLSAAAANFGISAKDGRRQFFQAWSAQAIFNATLVLLGKPDLIEYGVPVENGPAEQTLTLRGPPVWISTIGRAGFVPLASYPADGSRGFLHLQARDPADIESPRYGDFPPLLTCFIVLGLVAAILWHASVVVRQVLDLIRHPRLAQTRGSTECNDWIANLKQQRVTGLRRVFVLPWRPVAVRRTAAVCVHAVFVLLGLLTVWFGVLATWNFDGRSYRWAIASGVGVATVPLLLFLTDRTDRQVEWATATRRRRRERAWMVTLAILGSVLALVWLAPGTMVGTPLVPYEPLMAADRGLSLGTLVSPTVPVLCFALLAYVWLVWQLRVLSFVGHGYTNLFGPLPKLTAIPHAEPKPEPEPKVMVAGVSAGGDAGRPVPQARTGDSPPSIPDTTVDEPGTSPTAEAAPPVVTQTPPPAPITRNTPSMMSLLLSGELSSPAVHKSSALPRWYEGFTRAFDLTLPVPRRKDSPVKTIGRVLLAAVPLGLVGLVVWLRVHTLEGLAFTIAFRVATVGGLLLATVALLQTYVQWRRIGGVLVRVGRSPLAPAFSKVHEYRLDWHLNLRLPRREELALLMAESDGLEAMLAKRPQPIPGDVPLMSVRGVREKIARELLVSFGLKADPKSLVDEFERERHAENLRLMNSDTFESVWRRCDRYLPLLEAWFGRQGQVPDKVPYTWVRSSGTGLEWFAIDWFQRAQTVVALTHAFVIRDALSRIIAGLSVACLCFLLLLAAHLLYSFPGRSTLLTIDWTAVGLAGAVAVWILVAMERSVILSHLWGSDPGRVSFNRDFVQRLALYGALPVLTLVSALFPEMGDTIFGWLAPARQLAGL